MSLEKHFHTPPIEALEKGTIFRLLGFDAFDFRFVQLSGDTVLGNYKVDGNRVVPILGSPVNLEKGSVQQYVNRKQLETTELFEPQLLSDFIFDFPYSFVLRSLEEGADSLGNIDIQPSSLRGIFGRLASAVNRLDLLFSKTELNLLKIKRSGESLCLLFHYVRRRCIRVGFRADLPALVEQVETGALQSAELKNRLGAAAAVHHLDMDKMPMTLEERMSYLQRQIENCERVFDEAVEKRKQLEEEEFSDYQPLEN